MLDPRRLVGETHPNSILSDAQVAEIRVIREATTKKYGLNIKLAKQYGVSVGCIEDIVYGKSRTEVARPLLGAAARLEDLSIPIPFCGCRAWLGSLTKDGYGQFLADGRRSVSAHKAAYELVYGPVPDGLELDHLCRVRCCINPEHLEPVTHAENIRRGEYRKGWDKRMARKTLCINGHPYTGDNVVVVSGQRKCVICRKAAKDRWYVNRGRDQYFARKRT